VTTAAAGAPTDDVELLRRIGTGDREALAALYDRHAAAAFTHALRITGERSRAEDAVESTFLALWRGSGANPSATPDARTRIVTTVHRHALAMVRERSGVPRAVPSVRLASA
jgi:RNA polymerase sigma-70 factor (ECF subfamily)